MATEPRKASGKSAAPAASDNQSAACEDPIVVNMGKKKKKAVRRLRRGKGKLMDDVFEFIEDLRDEQKIEGGVQPVVFIVQQKRRGKGRSMRRLFRL